MRLRRALEEYVIGGIETTIPLHQRLADDAEFIDGDYDIHWLERFRRHPRIEAMPSLIRADSRDPARGLCGRHLPDGRIGRRPGAVLGRSASAAASCRSTASTCRSRLRRVVRQGAFRGALRQRLRGTSCAAAPRRPKSAPTPGSTTRSCGSTPALFARGAAHSVECWHGERAGRRALRRLDRRRVFRREHVQPRHRRQQGGAGASGRAAARSAAIRLLDTQFLTPHLAQFGGVEMPRARYHRLLAEALRYRGVFPRGLASAAAVMAARARATAARSPPCNRAGSRRRPDARAPTAPGSTRTSSR